MDTSTVAQTTAGTPSSAASTSSKATLTSDFDTFLKMLTTQAQNQDPFNPVDATEYASQLASFSAVEQQVLTNDLLTGLTSLASDGGFERLASWIGLESLVPGGAYFDGSTVAFDVEVPEDAQSAILVLRDSSGTLRNKVSLVPGSARYLWDGTDLSGATLPEGLYQAEVELYQDGVLTETLPAQSYMRIDEVRRSEEGFVLTLQGGWQIGASEIAALRHPAS
uniref:Basal-body rod modification protein FlgD n=1 Tax=Alloyangia mangrovi TaxID=1779329 RepID=A0A2A3JX72_9RHOB